MPDLPSKTLNVMVTVNGVTENGVVRTSLHMYKIESEAQLDAWLDSAPVKQEKFEGPQIHVEIPRPNTRRKE